MDEPNGQTPEACNSSQIIFDNFTILRELENITNNVSVNEFLEIIPQGKSKRLKWPCIFDCLKRNLILDEMVQEFSSVWEAENITEKLKSLEAQKEKFSEKNLDGKSWRPYYNVKNQLLVYDVADLKKQKKLLEKLAEEYKERTKELENSIETKANYINALQMDMEKYIKINDEIINKIQEKLENNVCQYGSKAIETSLDFSTKI